MAYDYREAVKDDVLEYINNEINFEDFDTLEELEEHLGECTPAALEEIEDDFNEAHEGEESEEE